MAEEPAKIAEDQAGPKIDLAEISKGVELKAVGEPVQHQDEALAQAVILHAINVQGDIHMPEERQAKVEAGLNAAVAQGATLRAINKQGIIAMPHEHAPKESSEHLARACIIHEINKQGVIAVPEGHAPNKELTPEQVAAFLAAAEIEKAESAAAKLPKKYSCDAKEGEWNHDHGFSFRVIREDRQTLVEHWKAGSREGPHRHTNNDLSILIAGKITVTSLEPDEAGAWKKVTSTSVLDRPGDFVAIPAGTVHSVDYQADTTLIYQQDDLAKDPEFLDPADKLTVPK